MQRYQGTCGLTYKALILCLVMLTGSLFLWGCSKGTSGADNDDANITPTQSGSVSDNAVIGSSTGGAITVETKSGLSVMVDIPAKAMEYSREITLSVEEDDDTGDISIDLKPSIALTGQATLTIIFPSEGDADGLLVCRKLTGGPLKQGMVTGTISASLYRLGEFLILEADEDDLLDAAQNVIDKSPDGSWQDAYETFDTLIWLSDYFSRQGFPKESVDCFLSIVTKCKESVDLFLASLDTVDKGSREYIALQKFQNLMTLCENPDQILSTINSLLTGDEEE